MTHGVHELPSIRISWRGMARLSNPVGHPSDIYHFWVSDGLTGYKEDAMELDQSMVTV